MCTVPLPKLVLADARIWELMCLGDKRSHRLTNIRILEKGAVKRLQPRVAKVVCENLLFSHDIAVVILLWYQ